MRPGPCCLWALLAGCVTQTHAPPPRPVAPNEAPAARPEVRRPLPERDAPPAHEPVTAPQQLDVDGDEISDADDACPTAPETKNHFEDRDGCPDEIPPDLAALVEVPLPGVAFVPDKATLLASSRKTLDRVVAVMTRYPSIAVLIAGHTDARSRCRYGLRLSIDRAEAVRDYLRTHGIEEHRLHVRGDCGLEPIGTNETAAGRKKNRRIELRLLPGSP